MVTEDGGIFSGGGTLKNIDLGLVSFAGNLSLYFSNNSGGNQYFVTPLLIFFTFSINSNGHMKADYS